MRVRVETGISKPAGVDALGGAPAAISRFAVAFKAIAKPIIKGK